MYTILHSTIKHVLYSLLYMAYVDNHSTFTGFVRLGQKASHRINEANNFISSVSRIYDTGKLIYNVARNVAPVVATGMALI